MTTTHYKQPSTTTPYRSDLFGVLTDNMLKRLRANSSIFANLALKTSKVHCPCRATKLQDDWTQRHLYLRL